MTVTTSVCCAHRAWRCGSYQSHSLFVSLPACLFVCVSIRLSATLAAYLLLPFSRSSDMIASLASAFSSIAHVASEMLISGDLKTETGK